MSTKVPWVIILVSSIAFGVRSAVVLPGERGLPDDALAKLRGGGEPIYCQACQECYGSGTFCSQDTTTCEDEWDVGKKCALETGHEQVRWWSERCKDAPWGNSYCEPGGPLKWMKCKELWNCTCKFDLEGGVVCGRSAEDLNERRMVVEQTRLPECFIYECPKGWATISWCTTMK